MAPDCKSGRESVRWFESIPTHHIFKKLNKKVLTNCSKYSKINFVSENTKKWSHSSAGRASALQAGGHRFDPYCDHHFLAWQFSWLECRPVTAEVDGSSPFQVATKYLVLNDQIFFIFGFVAQLVEQGTENPRVSGSIPLEATNERQQYLQACRYCYFFAVL